MYPTKKFRTVEDLHSQTFFDAFADAFTPPEDLVLHEPETGYMAYIRMGDQMRKYSLAALGALEQEINASQTSKASK